MGCEVKEFKNEGKRSEVMLLVIFSLSSHNKLTHSSSSISSLSSLSLSLLSSSLSYYSITMDYFELSLSLSLSFFTNIFYET